MTQLELEKMGSVEEFRSFMTFKNFSKIIFEKYFISVEILFKYLIFLFLLALYKSFTDFNDNLISSQ